MPEGPEVETVVRSLEPRLVGQTLRAPWCSNLKMRRTPTLESLRALEGAEVLGLGRKGKLFWLELSGERVLWVRLGMSGRLLVEKRAVPRAKHTHVVFRLGDDEELRYVDPRRFGEVWPCDRATLDKERARLGPDPVDWDDDELIFCAVKLSRTGRSVKEALLDQLIFAGVGNIYASEACFHAGVHPERAANALTLEERALILEATSASLRVAVENRGTTFDSFVDGNGERGDNVSFLAVFNREGEPCPNCGASIERIVQGGRSTFLCSSCQR